MRWCTTANWNCYSPTTCVRVSLGKLYLNMEVLQLFFFIHSRGWNVSGMYFYNAEGSKDETLKEPLALPSTVVLNIKRAGTFAAKGASHSVSPPLWQSVEPSPRWATCVNQLHYIGMLSFATWQTPCATVTPSCHCQFHPHVVWH